MEDVGILYGHLVYFKAIWCILWAFGIFYVFGIFFAVLVCCTKKNLATLPQSWHERAGGGLQGL
jgi:hypothetical protein